MTKKDKVLLEETLSKFTGSIEYFRISSNTLLTEGVNHVAQSSELYWLIKLYSNFLEKLDVEYYFVVFNLIFKHHTLTINIENGNGAYLNKYIFWKAKFPLTRMTIYGCRNDADWVVLLPSEY